MESWYWFVLVGLICGVFSAMFGVGSGIIMVPMLALAFHFSQKSAQGVSLAVMVPMALVGAIRYRMNPEIDMDMAKILLLAAGAVVGAWVGALVMGRISGMTLRRVFAVIMAVAALRMFLAPEKTKARPVEKPASAALSPEITAPPPGTSAAPGSSRR